MMRFFTGAGLVDLHGTVSIPSHQEAHWMAFGSVNWHASSRLWLGSQSTLFCHGNDTGFWDVTGPVAWHGPGHVHLEALKASWLPEGHLHVNCRMTIEECEFTAENLAFPSLFSEGRIRMVHSKVGGILWEHQGQGSLPSSASAFFAQDSHWEDSHLTLSECHGHIWDNDFIHTSIHIDAPLSPFKVTGNTLRHPGMPPHPRSSLPMGTETLCGWKTTRGFKEWASKSSTLRSL